MSCNFLKIKFKTFYEIIQQALKGYFHLALSIILICVCHFYFHVYFLLIIFLFL